jgi:hypothetical protein
METLNRVADDGYELVRQFYDAEGRVVDVEKAHASALKRDAALESLRRKEESFRRSDTDGFVSQWASQMTADKYELEADLLETDGLSPFRALFDGDRRLDARLVRTRYGTTWRLGAAEERRYGRAFVPFVGDVGTSKVQKALGLRERFELAAGVVKMLGGEKSGLGNMAAARYIVERREAR